MILLNFSHPITDDQKVQIEKLAGQKVTQVIALKTHFDDSRAFPEQLMRLTEQIPLSMEALQTKPILVNPPALNFLAALVISDLHGRMGYFPPILRLRAEDESIPPRYEVAEILNLQQVRNAARKQRMEEDHDR